VRCVGRYVASNGASRRSVRVRFSLSASRAGCVSSKFNVSLYVQLASALWLRLVYGSTFADRAFVHLATRATDGRRVR